MSPQLSSPWAPYPEKEEDIAGKREQTQTGTDGPMQDGAPKRQDAVVIPEENAPLGNEDFQEQARNTTMLDQSGTQSEKRDGTTTAAMPSRSDDKENADLIHDNKKMP